MYQTGDLLIYGSTGVCRVLSIDRRQDYVDGIKQDKLYYQLKPLHQGGVIYTPVDNSKVVMRPVISREEAEALIDTIPTLQPMVCKEAQKRRLGMVDERFMKQAEQLLYGELSAALDIPYDEVQPYIASRMEALVGA